jgi:hypothetical protein
MPSPYQRGQYFDIMPIPRVIDHCVAVDAGPLRFEVESRDLTNEILRTELPPGSAVVSDVIFDDYGASLHVVDPATGLEHLRFDCFEHEPHYHYIDHAKGGNLICRIDEVAEGEPIDWTLARLRHRLPEMLESCGLADLAGAVRADLPAVVAALDQVAGLLDQARVLAEARRPVGAT